MANEARVTSGLQIRKSSGTIVQIDHQSRPGAFNADVNGTKGPCPGALTIPVYGKVVDLTELSTPGLCILKNMDPTNYVTYGIWDVDQDRFYPFGEILPGEEYVVRFSRNITEEYPGTGTGTTSAGASKFFMMANKAQVNVNVGAFEA